MHDNRVRFNLFNNIIMWQTLFHQSILYPIQSLNLLLMRNTLTGSSNNDKSSIEQHMPTGLTS